MTRAQLSQLVADSTGHEETDVKIIVEATIQCMKDSMIAGNHISLRGFGNFIIKKRQVKLARNIGKSQPLVIPAHFVPYFRPSQEFKNAIKSSKKVKEANHK